MRPCASGRKVSQTSAADTAARFPGERIASHSGLRGHSGVESVRRGVVISHVRTRPDSTLPRLHPPAVAPPVSSRLHVDSVISKRALAHRLPAAQDRRVHEERPRGVDGDPPSRIPEKGPWHERSSGSSQATLLPLVVAAPLAEDLLALNDAVVVAAPRAEGLLPLNAAVVEAEKGCARQHLEVAKEAGSSSSQSSLATLAGAQLCPSDANIAQGSRRSSRMRSAPLAFTDFVA